MTDGEKVWNSFADLRSISYYLNEPEFTRDVFRYLDKNDRKSARLVYHIAEEALIRSKSYKLCGSYLNPEYVFRQSVANFRRNMERAKKEGGDREYYLDYARGNLTSRAASLIALLAANDRGAEAKKMAEAFKKEWADDKFHAEVDRAAAGTFPSPWPDPKGTTLK